MDSKTLCMRFVHSDTEADVTKILQDAGLWDTASCWRHYGGLEDDWPTIGNEQRRPEVALAEKIVNSIDAVLMRECLKKGIEPESPQAPSSINEALEKFFGIRGGRLSNLGTKSRAELAQNICLVASGSKNNPCYSIIDKGEGQTPNRMQETLSGLCTSDKKRIPFVQGKLHMSGTGALRFYGHQNLQLIISRRDPMIARNEINDASRECWGFTIVRRQSHDNGQHTSTYTYLAPNGEILRFIADSLLLLPGDYPDAIARPLRWGTYVKLYEYHVPGLKTNVVFDLDNTLSILLPNIALPVTLYERRKGYSGRTLQTTLSGLSVRLEEDKRRNLENGSPISGTIAIGGQRMNTQIYTFKKGRAKKYRRNEGIIFTVDGRAYASLQASFFSRMSVKMDYLKDSLLVMVDCSELDERLKEELLTKMRDRLCPDELQWQIERVLERLISDHVGLRELRERRMRELIQARIGDPDYWLK